MNIPKDTYNLYKKTQIYYFCGLILGHALIVGAPLTVLVWIYIALRYKGFYAIPKTQQTFFAILAVSPMVGGFLLGLVSLPFLMLWGNSLDKEVELNYEEIAAQQVFEMVTLTMYVGIFGKGQALKVIQAMAQSNKSNVEFSKKALLGIVKLMKEEKIDMTYKLLEIIPKISNCYGNDMVIHALHELYEGNMGCGYVPDLRPLVAEMIEKLSTPVRV